MSRGKTYASFYLHEEQMAKLKARSEQTRLSMSEMVRQAIDTYLRGDVIRPIVINQAPQRDLRGDVGREVARALAKALRSLPAEVQTPEFDALDELLAKVVDPSDVDES